MKERWVTLRLGGYLGRAFGRKHRFLVCQSKEAIKALAKQKPEFAEALKTAHLQGVEFAVFNGKHNINNAEELNLGAKDELKIVPVVKGSKKAGLLQTIIGVVLIAVSFIPGFQLLAPVGIGLALGGIQQLLTPQVKGLKTKEDSDNKSYAFGGPVNTTAQGNPVGVLYGKREVGGAVISASILAEDQA